MNELEENRKESFLDFFEDLEDPRLDRKKLHGISEILLVTLAGVICGAEGWIDIEKFGNSKLEELRKYLPFANGIPSDDTLRRFFRRIDPKNFKDRFVSWIKTINLSEETLIAIDGKVSRHTFDKDKAALHMVSAFASESRLVLAQTAVDTKSNEITAIPSLLEWLDLRGAIVTIDAMGCQREIAEQINKRGGDYVFSLKGNQGSLNADVRLLFSDEILLKEMELESKKTVDCDHGRIETRKYCSVLIPDILKNQHNWPGLRTVIEVSSRREIKRNGVVEEEKRYYISSLNNDIDKISKAIRSHWSIENSLHYIMDISFRDDESRIRQGNAPENIAVIKHVALNMLQANKQKRDSIKGLRKVAAWNNDRMHAILSQKF
jgi:predicted transposase YbfD/YdcC